MANPGDKVKILTKDETIEGILMPSEDSNHVVVKLGSGYNIGLKKSNVRKVQVVSKKKADSSKAKPVKQNSKLSTITILHTGGTIASKVDYETGGTVSRYSPEEILSMFPELGKIANGKSRLIRNMWSEDMRFAHYNILAKEVEKEIKAGSKGIIITHGTDTLHYTSAALSFALENLTVPVLVVGAQRSSDRGSSDSAINLLAAAEFIVQKKDFAEVAVCMHETTEDKKCVILPGTKCRKMHSSRRDAFKAINSKPWATVEGKKIEMLRTDYATPGKEKLKLRLFKENIKVGLLKIYPNMFAEQFSFFKGYDGLLIEGTGIAGNVPINKIDNETKENEKIFNSIRTLVKSGVVLAAATQTIHGRINMNVYSTGRRMQELGILGNYLDMTPETAFIKLAWLLSNYKKDVKILFSKNLRGEISERIEKDDYLE